MTLVASAQMLSAMPCAWPAGARTHRIMPRGSAWGAGSPLRAACWDAPQFLVGSARRHERRRVLHCKAEQSEGSDFDLSQWVEGKVSEGESLEFGSAQIAWPELVGTSVRLKVPERDSHLSACCTRAL